MGIVTLLTDFGRTDSYVAQMKGVILEEDPSCRIVDITHEVERHGILAGSFLLETAVSYFPTGTVHVGVVDPGVGSARLPIVVVCGGSVLVGPDNGLLSRAADKLGAQAAYQIKEKEFLRRDVSSTFHGRDIFAKTAGMIAAGQSPVSVGPRIRGLVRLDLPRPKLVRGVLQCNVLHVDGFGNVITNLPNDHLPSVAFRRGQRLSVVSEHRTCDGWYADAYYQVKPGNVAVLKGSQGYVEVAAREARASELLAVRPLEKLEVRGTG
jgi:S-adenosylmethionine hydrolase